MVDGDVLVLRSNMSLSPAENNWRGPTRNRDLAKCGETLPGEPRKLVLHQNDNDSSMVKVVQNIYNFLSYSPKPRLTKFLLNRPIQRYTLPN